jgi:hypothetical protein
MRFLIVVICLLIMPSDLIIAQVKKTNNTTKSKAPSQTPIKTIQNFLSWYKMNYKRRNQYKMTYTDSNGNFRVDIKDCSGYFTDLLSSGCISQEYVRLWSDYCKSQDEKFIISPQNEGPPEGFDMDLVLHTQEPDEVTKHYKKFKYIESKIEKSKAVIFVDTEWPDWIYVFELSKIKDHWYIDYISIKEPA